MYHQTGRSIFAWGVESGGRHEEVFPMGLTRQELLKRRIQQLLDNYERNAKRVPKVEIVGYCVTKVWEEPYTRYGDDK